MPSSGVSLKPPLKAFARGVRIARVMTMSSGFLVVLQFAYQSRNPRSGDMNERNLHGREAAIGGRDLRDNSL
jgi:hypothetical protein